MEEERSGKLGTGTGKWPMFLHLLILYAVSLFISFRDGANQVMSTADLPTSPLAVDMRHMSSNIILGSPTKDHKSGNKVSQHFHSTDICLGSRSPNCTHLHLLWCIFS